MQDLNLPAKLVEKLAAAYRHYATALPPVARASVTLFDRL